MKSCSAISKIDKDLSDRIQRQSCGPFETLLLPFGWVFSGPKTIWVALLLTYYMAKSLSAHCFVPTVGAHELFAAFHTALYYAGMNLGLIFTIVGKKLEYKVFGRERPENRENKRLANLRKIQKNMSMPSGDSVQAAHFALYNGLALQQPWLLAIVPCVAFARVYYHCHWVGDTVVGALCGLSVAALLFGYYTEAASAFYDYFA